MLNQKSKNIIVSFLLLIEKLWHLHNKPLQIKKKEREYIHSLLLLSIRPLDYAKIKMKLKSQKLQKNMTYSKWKFSTTPTKNRREIVKNNKNEKEKKNLEQVPRDCCKNHSSHGEVRQVVREKGSQRGRVIEMEMELSMSGSEKEK